MEDERGLKMEADLLVDQGLKTPNVIMYVKDDVLTSNILRYKISLTRVSST